MTSNERYLDSSLPTEERLDDLMGRMTLPEKVGQMLQLDAQEDLGEAVVGMHAGSILHTSPERLVRAMELARGTRLRIPLLTADDAIHGHSFWPGATILPTQLAMACTWDPDLVSRGARLTAVEVAATGLHWTFSPVLCIARDLRWGRVGETFGEDPFLIGELASAMVQGYQGDGLGDATAVLACAKHFAGYSETQGGRDASEADVSRRKLRSWFLPPFERVARAGCRTFMLGYQSIEGVPITANSWLINEVLKGEWGFSGTLVTDWDNVGRMVWEQRVCADAVEAATVAIRAGNDLVMCTPSFFEGALEALARGLVTEADIDAAVRRILTLKFELGLFEDPRGPDPAQQAAVIGSPAHAATNLDLARRSLVLLGNDGVLPLAGGLTAGPDGRALPGSGRTLTIAVVGPNANNPDTTLGDWAGASGQVDWMSEGHPRDTIETVVDGLQAVCPPSWQVHHARGADIITEGPDDFGLLRMMQPPVSVAAPVDPDQLDEAVAAARAADVVVAVVGDHKHLVGEVRSTATLELFGAQVALLDALAETGTPMVVVLMSSKPMVLPESALSAAALVVSFNPGMRGGRAIAELLLGLIEPTGRLPISFARHVGQQPTYYNSIRGQHGDTYADLTQDPLFTFGQGMSYSTVTYSDLRVGTADVAPGGSIEAQVTVANTGSRPVIETVQAYISDRVTSVTWADRELKAYRQVTLAPGQSAVVEIAIPADSCTIVTADGRRVVEPGAFELLVGASARDADLMRCEFRITA